MGDVALKEIAHRIKNNTRQEDLVARLGGDEFAVILSSVANRDLATSAMNRIAEACGLPFRFEQLDLKIGASIGLAIYPEDALGIEPLIEFADQQMYSQKRQRKTVQ